jgi:hypothetical protein
MLEWIRISELSKNSNIRASIIWRKLKFRKLARIRETYWFREFRQWMGKFDQEFDIEVNFEGNAELKGNK